MAQAQKVQEERRRVERLALRLNATMVNDVCHAPTSYLLARPSTIPHPSGATTQTAAVLPANGANYATIANWIAAGCMKSGTCECAE